MERYTLFKPCGAVGRYRDAFGGSSSFARVIKSRALARSLKNQIKFHTFKKLQKLTKFYTFNFLQKDNKHES